MSLILFQQFLMPHFASIAFDDWIKNEKIRQIQKTIQNDIGILHQNLLGSFEGWENLKTNQVIDLKNDSQKIVAEIKNKFNTTKGNHKNAIYDDLKHIIDNTYQGYTGYYVEIIPQKPKRYNEIFVPSDNKTGQKKPAREDIRKIDGYSFYELVTGEKDALYYVFQQINSFLKEKLSSSINHEEYCNLFHKAYYPD